MKAACAYHLQRLRLMDNSLEVVEPATPNVDHPQKNALIVNLESDSESSSDGRGGVQETWQERRGERSAVEADEIVLSRQPERLPPTFFHSFFKSKVRISFIFMTPLQ